MRKKREKMAYVFLLPSFLGTVVFVLLPFVDVVRRSFFLAIGDDFVGFENYREVISNTAFQQASFHTIKFLEICIPVLLILSLSLSLGVYSLKMGQKWIESFFLLPMAIPVASVVIIWKIFFHDNGILNQILSWFHLAGKDWMNTEAAFWILIAIYIWKNLGYDMILWLASLSMIPKEQYEAARVSGANRFLILIYLTLPQLKGSAIMIGILSFINALKAFREAYLIAGEYPHSSIYMLQHLFYNWFTKLDIQKMSAASVMIAVGIGVVLILLECSSKKEENK